MKPKISSTTKRYHINDRVRFEDRMNVETEVIESLDVVFSMTDGGNFWSTIDKNQAIQLVNYLNRVISGMRN